MLVLFSVMFTMGAISGASIAVNESQGPAELENATESLNAIPNETRENLTANGSGWFEDVRRSIAMPVINVGIDTATAGLHFGYRHPGATRVGAKVVPWVAIAAVGGVCYRIVTELRRRL